ncbi:AroM family protein [Neobacillus kokaensis]|uniref:AroM family protein n=1 Tax=Neobacillus kokaensis TaxID=2759023 RepID=A0ABQ3NB00_9BACI|nr:AroM family protein [Neobacillus kokaensis]GHI01078.1 hypothetical protein AM1BK_46200 [Neobacillus kokaensis]
MITLITIGQTPREDLLKAFDLGRVEDFHLIGALDGVSKEEITTFASQPGDDKLYVVLKDGIANLNHEIIEEKIDGLIRKYEDSSDVIAILCMSEFTCTSDQTEIIYPIKVLKETVRDIYQDETTIIFVPIKEQLQSAQTKWDFLKGKKHIAVIHPKSETILDEIFVEMDQYHPDHIIMDCYGFDYELVAEIEQRYPCKCHNVQHLMVQKVKKEEK